MVTPAPPRRTGRRTPVRTADVAWTLAAVVVIAAVAAVPMSTGWFGGLLAAAVGLVLLAVAAERGERVSRSRVSRYSPAGPGGLRRSERGRGVHASGGDTR